MMVLLFSLLMMLLFVSDSQSISVMSYNIRYATESDGPNAWSKRKKILNDQIKFYQPDILGIQEGLYEQVEFLADNLPGYQYVGVGRDDGERAGEFSAIFYRADRCVLIGEGTFWLSPTPQQVSVGWDASMERICSYARFEDQVTKKTFMVFNTHFDHRGEKARQESARLIISQIDKINVNGDPFILMGDLNMLPQDKGLELLNMELLDSFIHAQIRKPGPIGTFNGFEIMEKYTNRIDYIFVSRGDFTITSYAVLTDLTGGKYPSDHFPVKSDLSFILE